MFFTESFLNARRQELLRSVVRFQYQIGGVWRDGEINDKQVIGTNVVVFVNVPSFGVNDRITAVRVLDRNDSLAGQQTINLIRGSLNSALIRFVFPLIEQS